MEKLQTVTDIFAWVWGYATAEFLGEAESNTEFEQMFDTVKPHYLNVIHMEVHYALIQYYLRGVDWLAKH
jgi:hypothetical protein